MKLEYIEHLNDWMTLPRYFIESISNFEAVVHSNKGLCTLELLAKTVTLESKINSWMGKDFGTLCTFKQGSVIIIIDENT